MLTRANNIVNNVIVQLSVLIFDATESTHDLAIPMTTVNRFDALDVFKNPPRRQAEEPHSQSSVINNLVLVSGLWLFRIWF